MDRKYDLWDKYFADSICDWNIWENWDKELIVNRLHDDDVEEDNFTDEEIDYFLNEALDYQKEKRDEDRQENIINLEDEINNAINNVAIFFIAPFSCCNQYHSLSKKLPR